jgi:hypothetical protein
MGDPHPSRPSISTSLRESARLPSWTLLLLIPGLWLLGQAYDHAARRPAPIHRDTLARFLPPDASIAAIERSPDPSIYRFEARSPRGDLEGELTQEGTLLWLSAPWESERVAAGPTEHLRQLAFEVTSPTVADGISCRLLSPHGKDIQGAPGACQPARDIEPLGGVTELPEPVLRTLRHYLRGREATTLAKLGCAPATYRATWSSGYGEQTLEVLEDGRPQLLILPPAEPVPEAVLLRSSAAESIRALILESVQTTSR